MKNGLEPGGRIFFATGLLGSGLLQLVRHDFVRLVPKLPAWAPVPTVWPCLSGLILVATGLALVANRRRRFAAFVAGFLLLVVLLLYLPDVSANPYVGYLWTNPCKTLALLGGAVLLAFSSTGRGRIFCAIVFGIFLVVCGVQHFVYADFVVRMIPAWLPGHQLWAYLTGAALIAGGIGVVIPATARLAALMTGLMIFLWVVFLHVPRAIAMPQEPGETAAIFEALAISGTGLLLSTCRSPRNGET